tara:strand:+ start:9520 stop:11046 length:1527 start_codon:yes stop_codon:yes gene_type:complete
LVIGSGIAGLQTALLAADHGTVRILTKKALNQSNTWFAQGGIAVALGSDDNPEMHLSDTLSAAAGLANPEYARMLVEMGPHSVETIMKYGVRFDSTDGKHERGLEAAHSVARVLHSGGAATGIEIQSALGTAVTKTDIGIEENVQMVDLLIENGRCVGVSAIADNLPHIIEYRAEHIVLATGGSGALYSRTTNPQIATGDGVAASIRAGAVVSGLEFFQFHPTALDLSGDRARLISEALRGAGAKIVDNQGHRFLLDEDPNGELAPRDVVARLIHRKLEETGASSVCLDATDIQGGTVSTEFPSIWTDIKNSGFDMDTDLIPIAPAAHYSIGGVLTDDYGRSTIPGLYVCGEAANTGVHGANRLASNSLLEGMVFAHRVVEATTSNIPYEINSFPVATIEVVCQENHMNRASLQQLMWEEVGIVRHKDGLKRAIEKLYGAPSNVDFGSSAIENAGLIIIGMFAARAAYDRKESRGAHYRLDHPGLDPNLAYPLNYKIDYPFSLTMKYE